MNLERSLVIYDCEIIKAIPDKNGVRLDGIEYCGGWHDHQNMGISVICAYDAFEEQYRVFLADNLQEFQRLIDSRQYFIGFNNRSFDDNLCRANGLTMDESKSLDLLVAIWHSVGLGPQFKYPTHIGYSLDQMCDANRITRKTGDGALAPVDWQRGKYGKVIDYCLNDVKMTVELFHACTHRKIVNPKNNAELLDVNLITSLVRDEQQSQTAGG